jgi:hypothetical protein
MSTETEIELGKVVAFPSKNKDMQDGLVIQREGQKVMCLHSAVSINGRANATLPEMRNANRSIRLPDDALRPGVSLLGKR